VPDRRVVLVTGAARGIGRAIAAALVSVGARVAAADLDAEPLDRTAADLGVLGVTLDVTDHAAFTAAIDRVEDELGPLDVLINNAGVMSVGPAVEESDASMYRQFDINVFAMMHGTRDALRRMLPRGSGHVVNIASMGGVVPMPGAAGYSASKHAIVGYCESLWWELRGTGVELSYVLPALVNTDLAAGVRRTRATGVIEPEEVASAVLDALLKPRLAVYAPRSMGPITKVSGLLPRRLGNAIMRASGSDHLLEDSLASPDRIAYQARVDASAPAADARRAPD
jgi:NADP-dependent 3-hydroxy acid dehydrogenase YdfG